MSQLSKHIILFDGFCVLCNSSVHWLLRHDKQRLFMFAPLQSNPGKQLANEYNLPVQIDSVVMISPEGIVYTHSDVMLEAFKLMGGRFRILSWFSLIPKVMRDIVYRIIAKYRYRWFGKNEACMIPDPNWNAQFLK